MTITFHGGAQAVTGANYLLEHAGLKLLVDCGLHQGSKYAEDLNYDPFAYQPADITAVFITHSHIDHIGRLPKLYKDGFRGVVYCTPATADLMAVALPDNYNHIAQEAERDGHPPLFRRTDVVGIMSRVQSVDYDVEIPISSTLRAMLHDAGHVLGSAIVEIDWGKKIFFSGDLGNPPTPLLRPTEFIHGADYLVVESAYGDRAHESRTQRREILGRIITEAIQRGGTLMIPSFALERTQEVLFELHALRTQGAIPSVPLFVDSPLAIKMTAVYAKHLHQTFEFPGLTMAGSTEESKHINDVPPPKIIIAGSGMSQGGRILHHERRYLPDPASTILFVGYQVDGSLGRRIQTGSKEVSIFHEKVPVRCHVATISSYSAHADQPALLHWITEAGKGGKLKKVFVVQGEASSADALARKIYSDVGVQAEVPAQGTISTLA